MTASHSLLTSTPMPHRLHLCVAMVDVMVVVPDLAAAVDPPDPVVVGPGMVGLLSLSLSLLSPLSS